MTVKQAQHLLAYLGYYTMEVDGIWGRGSEEALKRFQAAYGIEDDGILGIVSEKALTHAVAYGMPKHDDDPVAENSFWDDIEYFTREEFRCKCGLYHAPYCDGFPAEPREDLVQILEDVRINFGVPVTIISGLRCPQHNADPDVGGVSNSQHMYGEAADINVRGVAPSAVEAFLDRRGGVRYHYTIGISGNVHVDVPMGKR